MSINSAMQAGVSGLIANSASLAAISDNIANANTTGYKRNQIDFTDIVTSQAVRGRYSAGGVQGISRQYVGQQGLVQGTNSATDLAIAGEGFFVTTEKATNVSTADARLFTRAGSFHVDNAGYLINDANLYLQGWLADASGNVTPNPADLAKLSAINIKAIGGIVTQTTEVDINGNLDATQAVDATKVGAYDPLANSMTSYNPTAGTGTEPDYEIQTKVTDSLGASHQIAISFLRSATPNQWYAEVHAIPASDIVSGAGLDTGQIAAGVIAFTPDGQLDLPNTTLFPSGTGVTIGDSGTAPGAGQVSWAAGLGISGQDVKFGLSGSVGSFTQLGAASAVASIVDNGVGVGSINGVKIDDKGVISATFDNGQTRVIGQIAIATFANPDGLTAASGNAYRQSITSGGFTLNQPLKGGAGKIAASALESSTVDLSSEFTGLITTQRAYSASSKIITTADQMLTELLSIIR
jgi:flagellar hook protein FlgE